MHNVINIPMLWLTTHMNISISNIPQGSNVNPYTSDCATALSRRRLGRTLLAVLCKRSVIPLLIRKAEDLNCGAKHRKPSCEFRISKGGGIRQLTLPPFPAAHSCQRLVAVSTSALSTVPSGDLASY